MPGDEWKATYDEWKTTDPRDRIPDDEIEDGCSCPRELGAGGARKTDKWCPLHGLDPDAEYERLRDER